MDRYGLIKNYFHAVEKLHYDDIMKFFTPSAQVSSPVLGQKGASPFYKELIAETDSMKINVKNIFQSMDHPHTYAAHCDFQWSIPGGSFEKECVLLIEFGHDSEKISALTIIYDAAEAREAWTKLHK